MDTGESRESLIIDIPTDLVEALVGCQEEAMERLGIVEIENPKKVVLDIYEYVKKELENPNLDIDSEDYFEKIMGFGSLWGEMVHLQYNWQWKYLLNEENNPEAGGGIYLLSPEKWYLCPPLSFMNNIMRMENPMFEGGESDNTIALLFNMMDGLEENPNTKEKYTIIV